MKLKNVEVVFVRGVKMTKMVSPPQTVSGFFYYSHTPAVYDTKTAYSLKEVQKYNDDGYKVDNQDNVALNLVASLIEDLNPPTE